MVAHWAVDFVGAWRQIKLHGLGFARAQIGLKFLLNPLTLNLKVMLGGTIISNSESMCWFPLTSS